MSLPASGVARGLFVPVTIHLPGVTGIADRPDAKAGIEIIREAKERLESGESPRDVLAAMMVKWGAAECIQALARAVGQETFRRAVEAGRLYATNVDEEWERDPS